MNGGEWSDQDEHQMLYQMTLIKNTDFKIDIKRIYENPSAMDGYRIFVDRLWPRGLKKSEVHFDEWMKEVAPSPELRKWFGHKPENWLQFQKDYRKELQSNNTVNHLIEILNKRPITLLYAAHDRMHNHALVLQQYLKKCVGKAPDK